MDYQKQLDQIFTWAVKKNASDILISVGHPPVFRVNQKLISPEGAKAINEQDSQSLADCLLGEDRNKAKLIEEKDIDFAHVFSEKNRFRVNIFYQMGAVSIALRQIPVKIKKLGELNLPPILESFAKHRQGLVLITGASSQGKSTTLAALIDSINQSRKEHIITIEDPIEYIFQDEKSIIEQREIGRDALSFDRALRAALRQDPNVIMVGEMRDLETISIAITAAETGHLVFATLHTNSASQTIHRIIDVFPPHQQNQVRTQLSSSLLGVVSQRLILSKNNEFLPACEVMVLNSAISNLIRENKIHEIPAIIETSSQLGMMSQNQCLANLVNEGLISKEEALSHSLSPEDLKIRLVD